jgi:hypothetical protein
MNTVKGHKQLGDHAQAHPCSQTPTD